MARRSARRGGGGEWKKSKGMMYALVAVIVIVWAVILWPDSRSTVMIPQAYISEPGGPITVYETQPEGPPPWVDEHTDERTAWEAWTSSAYTDDDGERIPFPKVVEDIPDSLEEFRELAEEGENEAATMLDPMAMMPYGPEGEPEELTPEQEEAMVLDLQRQYYEMSPVVDPEGNKGMGGMMMGGPMPDDDDDTVTFERYMTEEAKKIQQELIERAKNRD